MTKKTKRKQKSSASSLFSIHLLEDEDGKISVVGEACGKGTKSFDVGLEILANLRMFARENPEIMSVPLMSTSEYLN